MTMSPAVTSSKGRVLIVGATGFIGQFVTQASLDSGHPTSVLVRSVPRCPSKAKALKALEDKGVTVIYGAIKDEELMEKIMKEQKIEIVISAVGGDSISDQLTLLRAIKSVGTINRFLPSEFGHDVDRAKPVEPGLSMYMEKRRVRRAIEESGVPYTYICCNSIASWPYYNNTHPSEVLPPLDQFQIYGDGTVKAYFVAGTDIGKFTMETVEDIRTVNKNVHFRPLSNYLNINELASLWENKIGRTLPKITVSEDDLLAAARENIIPQSIVASFTHDIFIQGCQVNFSVDGPTDTEIGSLYPEEKFRTMDECFNEFLVKMEEQEHVSSTNGVSSATNHVVEVLPISAMCA